jgi:hypothetical protein
MTTYQIDTGYACFGIVLRGGECIEAAPIAKWMIGKSFTEIATWVKKKNGKIEVVQEANQ